MIKGYQPVMSFGDDYAQRDRDFQRGDEAAAVAFLEHRAGLGPALELGIGTGRIALPLVARGIRVDGIDLSQSMVDQLRTKPGGDQLSVTIGDFSNVSVAGTYSLIYVVFNTLFNLLTQDDQIRCFQNVASHLTDNGVFVVETYTPTFLYQLNNNQYVETEAIGVDSVRLDVLRHDAATQVIEESHVSLTEAGIRFNPVVQRYSWPSELDLMARMAGLRLKERFGGWHQEPFTSNSQLHISVYGR